MTLKSMTGFSGCEGSLEIADQLFHWTWEIKAVNGKSLDMRLRLPPLLQGCEQAVRKQLGKKIARGSLQANLMLEQESVGQSITINEDMMQAVLAASKALTDKEGITPVTFDGLLGIRGMVETGVANFSNDQIKALEDAVVASFDEALDLLVEARINEGNALQTVLGDIVSEIEMLTKKAENAPERSPEAITAKLNTHLTALIAGDHGLSEERLHQEALLLAAKADIKEETDRLLVHVEAARGFFALSEPVGRRLDFLAQEFGREANTLCSKANDVAITNIGLALKAAIEQFREQIQNVE